jgi:SNF2 family DNA or RNA helicase
MFEFYFQPHTKITMTSNATPDRRRRLVIIDSPSSSSSSGQSVISVNSNFDDDCAFDHHENPKQTFDITSTMGRVAISLESDLDSSFEELLRAPTLARKKVVAVDDIAAGKSTNAEESAWSLDSTTDEYFVTSNGPITMPNFRIPAILFNKLFDHQKTGVEWMVGLHNQYIGGLLGDDMGMGKTFMALTVVGGLMRTRSIRNALIIAPCKFDAIHNDVLYACFGMHTHTDLLALSCIAVSVLRSWQSEASKVLKACVPGVTIVVVSSDIGKATRCKRLQDALEW